MTAAPLDLDRIASDARRVAATVGNGHPSATTSRLAGTHVPALISEVSLLRSQLRDLAAACERDYVTALNAVLAHPSGAGPDPDRWRGHAEASRQMATRVHAALGQPAPDYRSGAWRAAHGVYSSELVSAWSATSRGPSAAAEARAGKPAQL